MRYSDDFVGEPQKLKYIIRDSVLAIIDEAQNTTCEKSLKKLFRGRLNELIPHQMAACGITERGKQWLGSYINIGFPEIYLRSVIVDDLIIASPVIKAWAENPVAQIFNDLTPMKVKDSRWGKAVERYGIRNMLVNSLPDIAGDNFSYFCLAQCPEPITEEHRYLMALITPHLHVALLHILKARRANRQEANLLTGREREVLCAMCRGHSNKEIAAVLGISGNTVRNHVYRICGKLGVANRTMAVAKANVLGEW